ncbi:ketopantoate reductase family protein [Desulfofustis glycolicus]|uniref:2-dehydropantoate 2-reductase n=1 Tax=Desulfofustis glycolicus DSM 9705 TaxID=1121409 RepID=A0A1M5UV57_9BACT|nr:2-dehydropantoate 2-reductase [Desulfofustis glycolicus]MCB2215859.1 2-dehydropantoate 2-reductase [Desulfobulbaceae bacterium]SHH66613.1 2-dehydropantoate 2-reductase [Desulfofustis glycolicus DSM 9705]
MKIAVMGSGGVGGYFGAKLAAAGCQVTFIARGAHLAAIRQNGLLVRSPLGEVLIEQASVVEDPREIGSVDLVLFGVKLWDTETAAEAIRPLITGDTGVISFQNGVIKDDILVEMFGPQAVVGGVCYIAATIAEPGVIAHTGTMQKLVFGEYEGRLSERVKRFYEMCRQAGIDAEISDDIRRSIWEKFVFLVGFSAVTATTRCPIGIVRANPQARHLLAGVMQEVVDVGRAEGVPLAPGFVEDRMAFCDQLPESMTASMHHDLERGNRLEVQWLSGDVSRRGEKLGVPAPFNTAVYDILAVHAQGLAVAKS